MKNALVDLVIVCGLLLWLLDQLVLRITGPFYRVARIAIIVVAICLIISVLLSLVDNRPPHLKFGEMPWLIRV